MLTTALSSPGIITVDGHDIRDLNPYWLRNHIGTVSQVIKEAQTPNTQTESSLKGSGIKGE